MDTFFCNGCKKNKIGSEYDFKKNGEQKARCRVCLNTKKNKKVNTILENEDYINKLLTNKEFVDGLCEKVFTKLHNDFQELKKENETYKKDIKDMKMKFAMVETQFREFNKITKSIKILNL